MFEKFKAVFGIKGEKKSGIFQGANSNFFSSPPIAPLTADATDQNSVIGACLRPYTSATGQGILQVEKQDADGKWVEEPNHPASKMLLKPSTTATLNQSYERLLWGLAFSDALDGNAYVYKLRNASNKVIGLQYLPHNAVSFTTDYSGNIKDYQVNLNGQIKTVKLEDIIHCAYGVDQYNVNLGVSPLKSAMRFVMTDNEIARYCSAIMRNPSPGYMLSIDTAANITEQQKDSMNASIRKQTQGENAGGILFVPTGAKLDPLRWSPDDMAIDKMSDLPEERICACMGVPPMVANLGSGLAHSTYSNFEEANKSFYRTTVQGFWNRVESAFTDQLMYEFEIGEGYRFKFKTDHIDALQESEDIKVARVEKLFKAGLIDRATSLSMLGEPSSTTDEGVYYTDINSKSAQVTIN